jgi:hypothetical protein
MGFELEYSCEIYGLFWRVLMDANGKGRMMALSFGGPRLETRYAETKHKWDREIEALSMKTHIVDVINFGKLNLKKKQKAY